SSSVSGCRAGWASAVTANTTGQNGLSMRGLYHAIISGMLPGEVEVHYATYDDFDDEVGFARLGPDLDVEEHARLARMRRPEPWRHFLVAHALRNRVGGEISNLTHTDGAVAVAVAPTGQVGVDVEDLTRRIDPREGFERFFTEAEWKWVLET